MEKEKSILLPQNLNSLQFITEHNIFWLIPMLSLALGMTLLLYWKETKNEYSKAHAITLGILRFLSLSLLFFLLLHPLLLHKVKNIEKPLILIAQDNSQSIILNADSNFYQHKYLKDLNLLEEKLREKFDLETISFGNDIQTKSNINFQEKSTDISSVGAYTYNYFGHRNIGAIILASDGIYNQGENPFFSLQKLTSPIYCIAMGDTSVRKDLSIQNIRHNKIAFKGNKIPIEITINSNHCQENTISVQLFNKGKIIFKKTIGIQKDRQLIKVKGSFITQNTGTQEFTLKTSQIEGELTYLNNESSFYIDILDSKEKVLLLYQAPHPDLSAIKQSLESSRNYEIEVSSIKDFNPRRLDYNLIILHSLPSLKYPIEKLLNQAKKQNIPLFFILSQTSDLQTINRHLKTLRIKLNRNLYNDVNIAVNPQFNRFTLSSAHSDIWNHFPPLQAPFGDYEVSPSLNTLFYQRIHNVNTKLPLLAFSEEEGVKNGILCGEGIWRWRLANYQTEKNHFIIDELFSKIVQFLSLKVRKKAFSVSAKKQYSENENIQMDAQLFDDNYELTKAKEVNVNIFNEKGEQLSFTFHEDGDFYKLNAPSLPAGKYHYSAKTFFKGKEFQAKGQFVVQAIDVEKAILKANHHLLYQLSKASNGKLFSAHELNLLSDELLQNTEIKPLIRYEKRFLDFLDFILLLALIILLLSVEWFLRKRFGGY